MTRTIERINISDSKLGREVTELVRDTEPPLLFHHSSRVYYFGALAGNCLSNCWRRNGRARSHLR
jgi:hypothetical protein